MTGDNYPELKFSDIEPFQDYYRDNDGYEYSVARLIDEASRLTQFDCPIAALDLSYRIWEGQDIFGLAFHCKKVMDASLDHPIILDWRGCLADGRHRVIKALIEGRKTVKAVRIPWRMEPCRKHE